tara:strand:+ start:317 stop:562 length:246 start_codon:yes stop_codon:yes gene_type:complete
MKFFLKLFFLTLIAAIFIGHIIKYQSNYDLGNKIIGFSVLIVAFIFLPLFLYNRLKNKKLSDYIFKSGEIDKMKPKSKIKK